MPDQLVGLMPLVMVNLVLRCVVGRSMEIQFEFLPGAES
jgi:hypothetical protein